MPHAAFWVVQPPLQVTINDDNVVSMPHAALWVVQQSNGRAFLRVTARFNAARGFVGGAATLKQTISTKTLDVSMPHAALWVVQLDRAKVDDLRRKGFNAARGFVGGAASSR